MNLIIAGGRDFGLNQLLFDECDKLLVQYPTIDTVICGGARGADITGRIWARMSKLRVIDMPANWDKYGKSAGYKRNEEMAKIAQACICFWDSKSKGTKHMIDLATKYGLELKVIPY